MWTRTFAILVVLSSLGLSACATADLRSDALEDLGAMPPVARADKGRAMVEALADRHGVASWRDRETVELIFRDDWDSALASMMGLQPWDKEDLIQMRYQPGTFNIRADFIGGPRSGEALGVQAWKTYARASEKEAVSFVENEYAGFILPALTYLAELPFRIGRASVIVYDSEQTFKGRRYDTVLATWGEGLEPDDAFDQYVLWIDKETGMFGMVDHTVREQGSFFSSRTIYKGYKQVQGVTVPSQMTIVAVGDDVEDGYLHQVNVESVRFDSYPVAFLQPDSSLDFVGDEKAAR